MSINAKWIEAPIDIGTVSPEFKKDYTISSKIKKATAKVSANGVYNFYVNGAKVGNALMAPGWTSYHHRLQYQAYDVTAYLQEKNKIEREEQKIWEKWLCILVILEDTMKEYYKAGG